MATEIIIKGAKENNLKSVDLTIPRDKLIVFTGLSGSGKSSLAFDTIYAEGQRRYMESLSSYARQFLGQMEKPNVGSIEGLSPAISIDQKTTSRNPRSTVGTVTEIHDYLRLLYARIGKPHCPVCGREITSQSVDQIVDSIMRMQERSRIIIMAPVVKQKKGTHAKIIERIRKEGFARVRVDGEIYDINEEEIKLEKTFKHTIEIVVDRLVIKDGIQARLTEACELAISEGDGLVLVQSQTPVTEVDDTGARVPVTDETGARVFNTEERIYSTKLACPEHGVSIGELEPRMFSFNNPYGACPECNGLGFTHYMDPDLIIADPEQSVVDGCFMPAFRTIEQKGTWYRVMAEALFEKWGEDITRPYKDLPDGLKDELMYGTGLEPLTFVYTSTRTGAVSYRNEPFEGILHILERRYRDGGATSAIYREKMEECMSISTCPACKGQRLRPEILGVTVGNNSIAKFSDMSIVEAEDFIEDLDLDQRDSAIAEQVLKEIRARLSFLKNVGLDYLTLSRSAGTLSGGESQRIRLATQIGSGLAGVLYILDEPSIGLHQKDNQMLLATLKELRDAGNTLVVVEHDEDTMYAADHIVDIGPGAGTQGGEIVAQGTIEDIKNCKESITGQYLNGEKEISVPRTRRKGNGKKLTIHGAAENNLKNLDVDIPLGKFVCVTGVSGSGKSSLINEILYKGAAGPINGLRERPGKFDKISGLEHIDKVINIDQSPIGRTPRSNPATYTGVFTHIRDLFAELPEAKMRGYGKGRFSFNVKGGRCEACRGDGIVKIEMHFLPDVYVPCEVCGGRRYNRETLEVKYKGKSIYDVLDMTISDSLEFFKPLPRIYRHLKTMDDVGLGYIKLGQPSTQLSGGEAQRIKLASELARKSTGNTLYILDEPTTGLHFADVDKLLKVLDQLTDMGNTVVVIEHNLDVIKKADHIIDLGPDGGDRGGMIVASGTPEEVAEVEGSYTGHFLKKILAKQE